MDTGIAVAIIGLIAAVTTGIIGYVVQHTVEKNNNRRAEILREQWDYEQKVRNQQWEHEHETERVKWEYERDVQARKQRYDEELWLLNLYAQRELKLHEKRIELYPQVFAALEALSRHKINDLSLDDARKLATQINVWAYGEVGLVMCGDTRDMLIKLRDGLYKLSRGEMQDRTELTARPNGTRTRLIELMRRDVSQSGSAWLDDLGSLIEENRNTVNRSVPARGTPITPGANG